MSHQLPWLNRQDIARLLPYELLIDALQKGFQEQFNTPLRHHHYWGRGNSELLMMPAWNDQSLVVKLVTLCPENPAQGITANNGVVVLFNGQNGLPLAMLDAGELTARRTAAASALASSYLSHPDADSLLVIGTGRLAVYLVEAHMAVRPIKRIQIWGRRSESARNVVDQITPLLETGISCTVITDLEKAVNCNAIISAATRAIEPVIRGDWLSPGSHLDLVGGYRPDMREVDGDAVKKSSVFADTLEGVLVESGDIIQPIRDGDIEQSHIQGELIDLCCGKHQGRTDAEEITLFKSVGTAFEDLVSANLAYNGFQKVES